MQVYQLILVVLYIVWSFFSIKEWIVNGWLKNADDARFLSLLMWQLITFVVFFSLIISDEYSFIKYKLW